MTVVHWAGSEGWWLLIAADAAGRTTAGQRYPGLLEGTGLGHGESTAGSGFRATISEIMVFHSINFSGVSVLTNINFRSDIYVFIKPLKPAIIRFALLNLVVQIYFLIIREI